MAAPPKTGDLGPKPRLEWLKLSQLYIPIDYQRSVKSDRSVRNIGYIKENFNWADCGALIVCPLPKSKPPQYAIIDGQHRFRAAEAHGGITELPCVVISEREASAQARNFVNINDKRVQLNPLQKYHAAVISKDLDAVSLDAILKKCGIAIAAQPMHNKEMHPRVTCAVGSLLKMISDYSEKQIVWALTIILEAYGDERGCLRANLIKGLAAFIKERPGTNRETMIAALQEIEVDQLEKDARSYCAVEGGAVRNAIVRLLERKYNSVKRSVSK
jgi:hypothetical protein